MYRSWRKFFLAPLVLVAWTSVAFAQLGTAQLNGRVTDESGGVLPGATVTVTQTDTGFTRTVVTNANGAFVLPGLPTGPYRLEAELPGFTTYVRTGIVLQVGGSPTINPVLPLGGLEESVTVEAASPLVDVRSAGLSEVVENERILELPLEGREVTSLLVLAGAAVQGGINVMRSVNGSARVSVGGGLSYGLTYLLDGAMHLNFMDNLNLPLPFPDALQEFSVATSGLSAQNGVHSAGSVSAVTKSGSNRFSGSAFEFFRDRRFNSVDNFAALGPDGKPLDDGLNRHQYGGTLGGPIVQDKLFFFGGYQGTRTRSLPTSNINYVPTADMLAGDFTTFASAQCNNRAVTLKAPFVNNRIDPALFSPAAMNIAARLPSTSDPCGEIVFGIPNDSDAWQGLGRVDYQVTSAHGMFGRWLRTFTEEFPVWDPSDPSGNVLTTQQQGRDRTAGAKSFTAGDTVTIGNDKINAMRIAYNSTAVVSVREPWFGPDEVGINNYTAFPGKMGIGVTGGFSIGHASGVNSDLRTKTYSVNDDFTIVKGDHQLTAGGSFAYWETYMELNARSVGTYSFDGNQTGLGLADFLTGQLFRLEQSDPQILNNDQTYIGAYVQDAWRTSDRVTINMGIRWEPYLGQNIRNVAIPNFSFDAFNSGQVSSLFANAPPGLVYPGDPGYPPGNSGIHKQWGNVSPRIGFAWDVHGDSRLSVRSSYALSYDFPPGDFQYVNAGAAPYASRLRIENVSFDDPYANAGGTPFPHQFPPPVDAEFPANAAYGVLDPNINSPRIQNWNATVEQQVGPDWGVSAAYLGSHSDRLWGLQAINPGVWSPGASRRNLQARRVLSLIDPVKSASLSSIDRDVAVGTQDYHALKLSVRRRAATSVSLSGNYTASYCVGNDTPSGFAQFSSGYKDPDDPSYDRGNCLDNRTHVANVTVGYQTPEFDSVALRLLASNWRVSTILSARSGSWLTFTTNSDPAGTGIGGQRLNQVSDDVYGAKTLESFINPDAFERPAPGTLGDVIAGAVKGPGFWQVNLGLSRLVPVGLHQLELRVEAFNFFNNFNWGNPQTNFDRGNFGEITSQSGDPRIMQFAVKYAF